MDLIGKVAVVTGGSAGVGRAYALALAGAGATVVAAARTLGQADGDAPKRNTLTEVVRTAEGLPGRVFAEVCDVSVEADVVRLVEQTVANFGRLDVLVNNAAVLSRFEPFNVSASDWDRLMGVNLRGPYLAIRQATPHMMRQRSGSIINITAAAGNLAPNANYEGTLPYAVSKAALNRLTYFVAAELKDYGIAVNALSPGVVGSDTALAGAASRPGLGPYKLATPEVLGPALLFLAQQGADGVTGQILHTDEFEKSWP